MHFQQAVPNELRSLAFKLEDKQPIIEQKSQSRSLRIAAVLLSLLAFPTIQVLGESCVLRLIPASSPCLPQSLSIQSQTSQGAS
ncbi:hypothetical protein F4813DRAFT_357339 [Daldinia decipiens]|uniref:uncharacterized protein n=1 Tax=Daldinia decipiens TaxID=326647 RepID=UPI0020C23084|nr:uncharacterized protein F4813DRAFT_357339 [Daldinia decipiens]KAI1658099.1 hypothetical protein F4813DRAFT_357339 [Daldinia decipiens]